MAKNDDVIRSQATSLRNLEIQLGKLANELRNRPQGTLPSDTENPRKDGKENCKAVTLRRGKNLELTEENCKRNSEPTSIQSSVDKGDKAVNSKFSNVDPEAIATAISQQNATKKPMNKPAPPFPQRFQKQQKDADRDVPIILCRPFLPTRRTLIDVQKWELTMRVNDQQVTFNEAFKDGVGVSSLEELEDLSEEEESQVTWVESKQPFAKFRRPFESLNLSEGNFKPPKPFIQEPPKVELKPLPSHLKYVYLRDNETLQLIVSAMLGAEKESLLLAVLKKYTRAIGWTMADIKRISPSFCMHKILLEDRYSSWVSPIQCVPKKGGVTVVANENNELIPTRQVTGWRVCMDYRKLNKATWEDHFPLPFIDQMLDQLGGKDFYCFLDRYSGYNQISIAPEDLEKTTFTCPYGTFSFRRMPFGLCNAPATFQHCMMAIFSNMVEKSLEVFMDYFSLFGESFDTCLANLEQVLARCE
ncbi:uncharacterized protein LOC133792148 [Humulus lupulus]|uniref:uncharacterized protein LOC133792148 n=1 Tax=Humulus lupulus TaxID=3486 RepID=UPI002B40A359|nr:uncharacterized protein LOC133792148 [Humulus lupulus]